MMKKSSSSSKCNHTHVPNKTTIKALEKSDRGEELQNFDNLEDLFASWESHTKEDEAESSNSAEHRRAKRKKVIDCIIKSASGKISKGTTAARSQDFFMVKMVCRNDYFKNG